MSSDRPASVILPPHDDAAETSAKEREDGSLSAVGRLKASLLTLDIVKAALAKSDPFDLLTPNDQAFISFAKIASPVGVAAVNSLNIFGSTLVFGTGHVRVNGAPGKYSPAQEKQIQDHEKQIRALFLCLTILSMPFTTVIAGLAHATEFATAWINYLSMMLFFEASLMATLSGLHAYYLTEIEVFLVCLCPIVLCLLFWFLIALPFKRPSLLCTGARLKKDTPASEYLKKVIRDNNLQDPEVMAKWLEENNVP